MADLTRQAHGRRHRGLLGAYKGNGGRIRGITWASHRLALCWFILATILTLADLAYSAMLVWRSREDLNSSGIVFNCAVLGLALGLTASVGIIWPNWWRRAAFGITVSLTLILLYTSNNLMAAGTTLALLLPPFWLGRELARALVGNANRFDAWVIGSAFGLGTVGLLGFVLGMLHLLRPGFVWPPLAIIFLALIVRARRQLCCDLRSFADWLQLPTERQPIPLLLTGIGLACLWLNLIGALAPEVRSDATRQRLVTAVHFATLGSFIPDDPALVVATDPALGEIAYAVAVTLGPVQSVKLIHWLAGLLCAAAIFALGRRLHSDRAGALAAFTFYTTVLVAYLSQTAYLDLLMTLFAVVAALCLTIGQDTRWRTTAAAGICTGLAVAVKVHFGYVAFGLAVTTLILAVKSGWLQAMRQAVILGGTAVLAAMPWLIRSFVLTGAVPGLNIGARSLSGNGSELAEFFDFGYGRSFGDLLAAPLTTTLLSSQFGGSQLSTTGIIGGHIGFLPLGLIPLLAITRLPRRSVAIVAGSMVAFLLWFYTAQYLRYALPILASLCTVGAVAYAVTWDTINGTYGRRLLNGLLGLMVLAGTLVRMQLPDTAHRLAVGLQSRDAYLTEWLGNDGSGSYYVLRLLNSDPSASRVLATHDGARLYTHVRMDSPADLLFEGDEDQVLKRLQNGGYSHILVNRLLWWGDKWSWDRMPVVNEDFLRRNTELVGGGNYSYLFRILPSEQRGKGSWVHGHELLPKGGFETSSAIGPTGWEATGYPRLEYGEANSHTGHGAILLAPGDALRIDVPVTPNTQYIVSSASRSVDKYGGFQLRIEWRDAGGHVISVAKESMPVSPRAYHTFSMLATTPSGATSATIRPQPFSGNIWFDDFSMRSVTGD